MVRLCLILSAGFACVGTSFAVERDPALVYSEKLLEDAGIKTDSVTLLDYLRRNTYTQERLAEIRRLVASLGHDEFEIREEATKRLIFIGRPALVYLRPAFEHSDPEIVVRARRCVRKIESTLEPVLLSAVVRLLSDHNPRGTTKALIDYLPSCEDDQVERTIFEALVKVGLRKGQPEPNVLTALNAKSAVQRAAAAHTLGFAKSDTHVKPLRPLLRDKAPQPRLEAAIALIRHREGDGVAALIELLEDAPLEDAWYVEETLFRLGRDKSPALSLGTGSPRERKLSRDAWQRWWIAHRNKIDLSKFGLTPPQLGLTLVTEYDGTTGGGRIAEWGKDGKIRWSFGKLRGVNDVQPLPDHRVLIAERNASQVTERDREGNILWQYRTRGNAICCDRLANGNTLITTFDEVLEVDAEGNPIHRREVKARLRDSYVLPNGHVLCATATGEVLELNHKLEVLRTIKPEAHTQGASYWASVEPLPRGRFLLALGSSGKVVEIDSKGKIHWECSVKQPVFAHRLPNGHTLISLFESRCLVEIDRTGKEVDRLKLKGRPFAFRRY